MVLWNIATEPHSDMCPGKWGPALLPRSPASLPSLSLAEFKRPLLLHRTLYLRNLNSNCWIMGPLRTTSLLTLRPTPSPQNLTHYILPAWVGDKSEVVRFLIPKTASPDKLLPLSGSPGHDISTIYFLHPENHQELPQTAEENHTALLGTQGHSDQASTELTI